MTGPDLGHVRRLTITTEVQFGKFPMHDNSWPSGGLKFLLMKLKKIGKKKFSTSYWIENDYVNNI